VGPLGHAGIALEDEEVDLGHGKTHLRIIGDVLHPEREDQAALHKIKSEIGSLLFSAQYEQRPAPVEGNLIRRSWLLYYEPTDLPAPVYPRKVVQSWDVAMMTGDHNDYSRSGRQRLPVPVLVAERLGESTPDICGALCPDEAEVGALLRESKRSAHR
jgi:hypothetical protein